MKKKCELCDSVAKMYCESDQASLCWECDIKVHAANFLVAKHSRTLLCHVCQSPTPWTGSGLNLGPTVSVCEKCIHTSNQEPRNEENDEREEDDDHDHDHDDRDDGENNPEEEDDGSDDDDGDGDDDEENQVVPWSPPPVSSSSLSSSEECFSESPSKSTTAFSSSPKQNNFSKAERRGPQLGHKDRKRNQMTRSSNVEVKPISREKKSRQEQV
ncbi:zinc finger protein CONSTANS-LIKE 4-like isoform X1 [Prunus avium]|uniref:Zinc finger protein CONSTANS-LIKE 4-like isoform X1 n=1 Tax=Prunus avium TaxID=42229 RepID=A0A6P5SP41_PRUAV|nr:zinc finger protein CONSTANS-LIKE 4-like isoform X1 [Prunus avium]